MLLAFLLLWGEGVFALTLEFTLRLERDGSGEAALEAEVSDQAAGILQELCRAEPGMAGLPFPPEQEAVERFLAGVPGVELEECRSFGQEGGLRRHVLRLRAREGEALLSSGALGAMVLQKPQGEAGIRVFQVPLPSPGEWTPRRIRCARMLLEALGGLEVRLTLEAPSPLLETTGRKDSARRCRWLLDSAGWLQDTLPEIQASWRP